MQEVARGVSAKEVGRALQAFGRTAKARQLYQDNSAALQRMLSDLQQQFTTLLEELGTLTLRVRSEALLYDEQVVLQDDNPDDSIPFALYRDGIRRLDFFRGLQGSELETLVAATAKGFAFSGLGDDIVSHLWKHDLEHVRYLVVDVSIVDAQSAPAPAGAATGDAPATDIDAQIDGLLREIYGESHDDVGPRSIHLDGSDLAAKAIAESLDAVDEMAPGFHPPRSFIERPRYAETFDAETEKETPNRVSARAANATLRAFAADVSGTDRDALSESLLRIYDAALFSRDLALATRVVFGMRNLPDVGSRVSDWMRSALDEPRVRQAASGLLSASSEDSGTAFEAFFRLLESGGPGAVPTVLTILPSFSDPGFRRKLSDLVVKHGVPRVELVADLLDNEQLYVVQEALYILARLDGAEARALEERAANDPRPEVRAAALATWMEAGSGDLLHRAERMLADPDPKTVSTAARALAQRPSEEASGIVERFVESPDFDRQALEVRRELFKSYATLCQQRALHLLSRYVKKGEGLISKRDHEELSVAAMDAVMLIPTARGVEILKRAAKSHNRRVREAAIRRLQALKSRSKKSS